MEAKRFDALARWLSARAHRRAFGLFGAATLGGIVDATTRLDAEGKKGKNKKKCGPCRKKKNGKCKGRKPDWSPCGGGNVCQGGLCVEPVCDPPCDEGEICAIGRCVCPASHACRDFCCSQPIEHDGDNCRCNGQSCSCPETAVLLAAGDIAACDSTGHPRTADLLEDLLDDLPGVEVVVAPLGDTAYQNGSARDFECYNRSWGRTRIRNITRPALGDHEYETPGAAGYFDYFGADAGERGKGYYSYDLGAWHIVVLNTNCDKVGGCGPDSPQVNWLRADLADNPTACTLAVIHHPRFSSGVKHGSHPSMRAFWQALYDFGADVVLSGNEHNYERFAPQTPDGGRDNARGIRQFVVGTGGIGHYKLGHAIANSEARNDHALGILEMTLRPGAYDWRFVAIEDHNYSDSGTGVCH